MKKLSSADEQRLAQMYGGKVPRQADLLSKKFQERKYFDSGDYMLSKAGHGKSAGVAVGKTIPSPASIPQPSSPPQSSRKGSIAGSSPPLPRKMSSSSTSSSGSIPGSPQQLGARRMSQPNSPQQVVYRKR